MKPEIKVSYLKTLIAIDEEGSFSAASERVGRTQSAVTQQMQNLELIVGTPIFETKGRRRKLTDAGLTLLRHAHEIISLCNQAISAAEHSLKTGTVRVGAPIEIAEELLPKVLERFSEIWPSVRVVIYVERSPQLMQMLEDGLLDLTVSTRRLGGHEGKLLTNKAVHWIAATEWKLNPKEPLPLIVTDEPSMFRRIALSALDISGQPYIEKIISSSMIGVRLAVIAKLGVTARTESSFPEGIQILGSKSGLPPLPKISYYLHQSSMKMRQECEDFFDIIVECNPTKTASIDSVNTS